MVLGDATVFHVNVNCSDLDRSVTFYRDGLGLTQGTRTAPERPQSGAAFGLDRAWWDAWILVGDRGFEGGAIDLLQWLEPTPIGIAPQSLLEPGWQRIGVVVADIDAALASAVQQGGTAWSEPFDTDGEGSLRLCFVSDPDGVAIELIAGGVGPRLAFVGMTCADLERSLVFYETLGFTQQLRVAASRESSAHLRIEGRTAMQEILLAPAGGGEVSLLLAGFTEPNVVDAPVRAANTLGCWRVALLVDDLDIACAALSSLGVVLLRPALLR